MLTIRLSRVGKKKQPLFRFIVSEKARDPWGKALEFLGTYQPLMSPAKIELNKERITYWMSKGAQLSDTVWNLFVDQGIVKGDKKKLTHMSKKHEARIAKKQKA